MGDDSTNEGTTLRDENARRRPWRIFLLTGVAGAGLALLLGILFRDGLPDSWHFGKARDDRFPPDALADYVPEDSKAVLAVNVRMLLETPAGRQMRPSLQLLVAQGERQFRWMELLGIQPFDDLDYLQISFAPGSGQPLWLARGRLDRTRFRAEPDKLQRKNVDHFHVWEYADRQRRLTTTLAPVGDTLVVSNTPARVLAALNQARQPHPLIVRDATLREILAKVDRRQSLWLAASFEKFGPIARIENRWLEMILRPLFAHADSVHGGLTCAEDVRAELHFRTLAEPSAVQLEMDLKSICGIAAGASLLFSPPKEMLPLFLLLSSGQINREGKTVSLHCRLAADQLGK